MQQKEQINKERSENVWLSDLKYCKIQNEDCTDR